MKLRRKIQPLPRTRFFGSPRSRRRSHQALETRRRRRGGGGIIRPDRRRPHCKQAIRNSNQTIPKSFLDWEDGYHSTPPQFPQKRRRSTDGNTEKVPPRCRMTWPEGDLRGRGRLGTENCRRRRSEFFRLTAEMEIFDAKRGIWFDENAPARGSSTRIIIAIPPLEILLNFVRFCIKNSNLYFSKQNKKLVY